MAQLLLPAAGNTRWYYYCYYCYSSFKCRFDTIVCQVLYLRPQADKGRHASLLRGTGRGYLLVITLLVIAVCLLTLRALFVICEQYLWALFSAFPGAMVYQGFEFWLPFFIMPSAPITTGIVLVLSVHIFVTSISRSLYLESFWNSLTEIFLFA